MTEVFSRDNENLQLTLLRRAEGTLSTELDGETVILAAGSGGCSSLDSVGTLIWNALEQPVRVGEIVDRILAEYDADRKECMHDARTFLAELHDRGLVAVSGQ